jgi:threonine/homoserine/homoserine lactone efflux protein
MATGSLLAFWAVAFLLIAVPGADWAFTIGAGLRGRSVVPAVAGLVLGYTGMTLVVAAGVGALVHPAAPPSAPEAPAGTRATLWQGVGVSGLNPKGLLIFVALLPQFADPDRGWPLAVQLAALGLVFVGTCAAFYLCLGTVARAVLLARPAAARAAGRLAGAGMAAIGAGLLVERLGG